ncbi:hypothetical protein [Aureimonas jatrophae]|uniref:hypothetical protein n=1 Tax=Aureimonas jatrophae TaxID=1166073 RepID=UPI000B82990F|nr:hypothetical protein [Aureimonas jatrophae]MBB3952709.1 hypothetical protein [Aureimonas jatrophae]
MIAELRPVMRAVHIQGSATNAWRRVFDNGEWWLSFQGAGMPVRDDPEPALTGNGSYRALAAYVADEPV